VTVPDEAPAGGRRARVGRRTVAAGAPRQPAADVDPVEHARQVCLDQLSYRARTRAELASAMAGKGVPDPVAEQVLDRFTEVGLVDDEAFARAWVTRRSAGKGLARRALAQELRHRGVEDGTAAAALDALDPGAEDEAALELVRRRLLAMATLEPTVRVRRLVALLARKGHPPGRAYALVREVLAEEGGDLVPDVDPDP
jgi:regulatory protein